MPRNLPQEPTNEQIAKLLREVSAALELKNENRFRVVAYERAATAIEHLSSAAKDLWDEEKLDEIPGVGENLAQHLDELFRTGKVKHFEMLKKGLPEGMFEILGLPGVGPKTAHKIASHFKIESVKQLQHLARIGKLRLIEGLGQETEKEILKGIAQSRQRSNRLFLSKALDLSEELIKNLKKEKEVLQIEALGSVRRRVATIGDIDLAVASEKPKKVVESFVNLTLVKGILEKGESEASVVLKNNCQVDLMVVRPTAWASLLQHFTGSKQHNIHLRKIANEKGLSLSQYGIKSLIGEQFSRETLWEFETEEEFYRALGMEWIAPELREDQGEIEAAQQNKLPKLVELSDVQGDLHLHSSFKIEPSHDLGRDSMEEMVEKAQSLSYNYIGFAEHSPAVSTHSTHQIIQLIKARNKKVEQLSKSFKNIRIIKLLEVDILADNRLALSDEELTLLDLAVAGIHSSHKSMTKTEMTRRIMTALRNPKIHILSHPTGRILEEREGYEADWEQIFKYCADHHKVLEINAAPDRLDLPDFLIREAKKFGVKFVINTDSHSLMEMENMKYGVFNARRGWAVKDDIINAWPYERIIKWLKGK